MLSYCQRMGGKSTDFQGRVLGLRAAPRGSGGAVVEFLVPEAHDWELEAVCRTVDPDIFFPVSPGKASAAEPAKAICRRCPVRLKCLQGALEREEVVGIWGGMTTRERRRLLRRKARHERFSLWRSGGTSNIERI